MVHIPDSEFLMGSDLHLPEERPAHRVRLPAFWIDARAVTNRQFRDFVAATGFVTVAERPVDVADYPAVNSGTVPAGSGVFRQPDRPVSLEDPMQWWTYLAGASWRHPQGPDSSIDGMDDHPVVHVTFEDAASYAAWAGKALPTEAQWECAARGGLEGATYSWGDEFAPGGRLMANVWRGEFPWLNTRDRSPGTMPVGSFPPNGYGIYDMAGNTWDWTRDLYRPRHGAGSHGCCAPRDPAGPGTSSLTLSARFPMRVLKGGSYLCAENYCFRYRPAARIGQTIDTSTSHVGFRCVAE